MIRRAISGQIVECTDNGSDKAIVCSACQHIIVSKVNLEKDNACPFCHNDVDSFVLNNNLITENEADDIAETV
jgi:uncharacterized CHY-type Zn-finger protein